MPASDDVSVSLSETDTEREQQDETPRADRPKVNWMKNIFQTYPRSMLIMMILINFNEGLSVMKGFAFKDLFKQYYFLEPSMS